MNKRILSILLVAVMVISLSACGAKETVYYSNEEPTEQPEQKVVTLNPLTGLPMDSSLVDNRPVAVMINNISTAQPVQTGLNAFDIVYEATVEGGITRLLGVTKDIASMPQIGTVRSARTDYLDLALGHDAIYVHAGFDVYHLDPHRKQLGVTTFDINTGKMSAYGFREKNGLATEHTMYTTGAKLDEGLTALGYERKTSLTKWLTFNDAESPVVPGSPCDKITIPFSDYITGLTYDAANKNYIRDYKGTVRKDYKTGETVVFDNVFVLFGSLSICGDEKHHALLNLDGGEGYYLSQGGFTPIRWSKGDSNATAPLKLMNVDGTELTVNAGRSYIGIVNSENVNQVVLSVPEAAAQ